MPEPSDSAIAAYYDAHVKEYDTPARVRVRHILVKTEAKAREARRELTHGGSWNDVVKRFSTDVVSKANGGLLGYVTNEGDVVPGVGKAPSITAAAFALKEGEVSQPLKTAVGWHLITADDSHPAARAPLSEVHDRIGSILQGQIQDEFTTALLDSLKKYSGATIFDDSIAVALRPAQTPQQLFERAQTSAVPADRIAQYRQLVARFPQERVSEQAAFMVGFTYAEELSDFDNASKSFEEFLKAYPHSDLAKSAQWMIENMNKATPPLEGEAPADSLDGAPPSGGSISLPDTLRLMPGATPADSSRGGVEPKQ